MIISCYTLTTSLVRSQDLLDVLRSISGPTLFSQGCILSDIWQHPDNPGIFLLHEEWSSLADLKNHIRSPLYHRLLSAMELCTIKPEVIFLDGSNRLGMEWVEQVRSFTLETD